MTIQTHHSRHWRIAHTPTGLLSDTLADATRRFNALLATANAEGTDVARNTP
jgi:hypothetical protein